MLTEPRGNMFHVASLMDGQHILLKSDDMQLDGSNRMLICMIIQTISACLVSADVYFNKQGQCQRCPES